MLIRHTPTATRRGAVAVELAILLPLLMFLAVIGVDYARIFSRTMIMETASRNACYYAAQDSTHAADTASIQAIALMDLTDISPTPTVVSSVFTGTDGYQYVKVTVSITFTTITSYPGVPASTALSRSTTMRVAPMTPKAGTY